MPTLLLLKLLLVPSLVAAVTLAARRWGPVLGGWVSGLPIVGGPVIAFYAVEQGTEFASQAAQGTMAALIAIACFSVAYAWLCLHLKWYEATLIGWIVFAVLTYLLYIFRPGVALGLALAVASVLLARLALPPAEPVAASGAGPPGDLVIRMIATAAMVLVLTALADRLGPALSGLLTAFPIATTTMVAFTQVQRGPAAVIAFFKGFLPALVGFALFCFVLAVALQPWGLLLAMTTALLAQFIVHGLVLWRLRHA